MEVCAFERISDGESLLVLHNVSATAVRADRDVRFENYRRVAFSQQGAALEPDAVVLPAHGMLNLRK